MTVKKGQKQERIFGIRIDSTSTAGVLREVRAKLSKREKFYIATPNPEIVTKAQEDKQLAKAINASSVSIPDGVGIVAAHRFLKMPAPKEIPRRALVSFVQGLGVGFSILFDRKWLEKDLRVIHGRELFIELIRLANKKALRVYFLGGESNEAVGAKAELEKTYKKIKIEARGGPVLNKNARPISNKQLEEEKKAISEIQKFKPHLLFVALITPKQEKWVHRWINRLDIGGAMVVGGTFRYISGDSRLPPEWMSEKGLEWLWRLINEPERAKRVLTAFPSFPLKVFVEKVSKGA
jgi:N-acetylglucosaminyldiphosphoundecaprenol N-acetyl-beta-D-mannosaminyltransferase